MDVGRSEASGPIGRISPSGGALIGFAGLQQCIRRQADEGVERIVTHASGVVPIVAECHREKSTDLLFQMDLGKRGNAPLKSGVHQADALARECRRGNLIVASNIALIATTLHLLHICLPKGHIPIYWWAKQPIDKKIMHAAQRGKTQGERTHTYTWHSFFLCIHEVLELQTCET